MGANQYKKLEALVRQLFASVTWSHKIQCKQADIYSDRYQFLKIVTILTSALTSAGIFSVIFADQLWLKIVSALMSFVVTAINSFFKSFDLISLKNKHLGTANDLWDIRERLLILLIEVGVAEKEYNDLLETYKEIEKELYDVYAKAPSTTQKAVALAKKALKVDGDNTFSDEEIDMLLPTILGERFQVV